jgi:hypothetical protein
VMSRLENVRQGLKARGKRTDPTGHIWDAAQARAVPVALEGDVEGQKFLQTVGVIKRRKQKCEFENKRSLSRSHHKPLSSSSQACRYSTRPGNNSPTSKLRHSIGPCHRSSQCRRHSPRRLRENQFVSIQTGGPDQAASPCDSTACRAWAARKFKITVRPHRDK